VTGVWAAPCVASFLTSDPVWEIRSLLALCLPARSAWSWSVALSGGYSEEEGLEITDVRLLAGTCEHPWFLSSFSESAGGCQQNNQLLLL